MGKSTKTQKLKQMYQQAVEETSPEDIMEMFDAMMKKDMDAGYATPAVARFVARFTQKLFENREMFATEMIDAKAQKLFDGEYNDKIKAILDEETNEDE